MRCGMDKTSPKKLLIINILDILKRYTDESHRLSQMQIISILEKEYYMSADRKTVKRNLMELIDFGYEINYSERVRKRKNGEDEIICTDWYLERDFSDTELKLIIDSLLFSKHIPNKQCKDMIEKIENLSSIYFRSKTKHIIPLRKNTPYDNQLFYTLEILNEAIETQKQVCFSYLEFDVDKKMHPRRNNDSTERIYLINPYQIVAANGRYYLIGNYDKYNNISHYRLDRIWDVHLQKSKVKPQSKISDFKNGLNLPKHMAEHIYMFSGESVRVSFRAERHILTEIMDWFGNELSLSNIKSNTVDVSVSVNKNAMICWALQFGRYIEVLSPQSLRDEVAQAVAEIHKKYKK